jgi:hypothetical protein
MIDSDPDSPVRHVLDRMESMHRRVVMFGWLTVAGTLGSYAWLSHVANASKGDDRRLIMAAVLALTAVIAWSTFALATLITRIGKRILRALEAIEAMQ